MKKNNGWCLTVHKMFPLTTDISLTQRTDSTSSLHLPVRVHNGVKRTLSVCKELLTMFLSKTLLKYENKIEQVLSFASRGCIL